MILFYAPTGPFGCFSNFSRHVVNVYNQVWTTSEYPFQAMKFSPHRPDLVDQIAAARTPSRAAAIGRDTSLPLHPRWDAPAGPMLRRITDADQPPIPGRFHYQDDGLDRMGVTASPVLHLYKDVIMYEVVHAKFSKRDDLQAILLDTGDEVLVEDAVHDPYWGWGASHVGENKLGRILMAVRASIRLGEGYPILL